MFWVENCVACAGCCVGCCWCNLLSLNVTRCKTKRKAEKKSKKKLAVPNIFGRILPKLVLAAKDFVSGMNSTSSACANCQKWFWLPKIFFGNVAANFEKVGNVNVFSSDNCYSLCSRPRHQNMCRHLLPKQHTTPHSTQPTQHQHLPSLPPCVP